MAKQGYLEGQNVSYVVRWAMGDPSRMANLAREMVDLKPNVIVAPNMTGTYALQRTTKTIPVIFAAVSEPVANGFVKSLASPGGNITGTSLATSDFVEKSVEFLRTIEPSLSHIGVLFGPDSQSSHPAQLLDVCRRIGIRASSAQIPNGTDADRIFAWLSTEGVRYAVVLPSGVLIAQRRSVAEAALRYRIATAFTTRDFVEAGGLLSYGANIADSIRDCAPYVAKILRGAKPAELPVEQPLTLHLAVNLRTAETLGIALPASIMIRANEVIR